MFVSNRVRAMDCNTPNRAATVQILIMIAVTISTRTQHSLCSDVTMTSSSAVAHLYTAVAAEHLLTGGTIQATQHFEIEPARSKLRNRCAETCSRTENCEYFHTAGGTACVLIGRRWLPGTPTSYRLQRGDTVYAKDSACK